LRKENLRLLLLAIKFTLEIALAALAAFSPWIVFSLMLSFGLINAWIAFAVFIIYIAAIIFLSTLADYVRKQNRKT